MESIDQNTSAQSGEEQLPLWIFGYGSLVWRPAFEHVEVKYGYIKGYKRRFWQGSTDHRGVVGAPGRVVTLIHHSESDFSHTTEHMEMEGSVEGSEAVVWGVCYQVAAEKVRETLEYLDVREQGGYTRTSIDVFEKPHDEAPMLRNVLLYTATTENANYLGPAPIASIAQVISKSVGPSGPNQEYLLQLYNKLKAHGIDDPHIISLVQHLTEAVKA